MSSSFDIQKNCVRIQADISGRGVQFCGSGVLYPLGEDCDYDYVLTAQHILKQDKKKSLTSQIDKVSLIQVDIYENGSFVTYKTIAREGIAAALLCVGDDFLIIKIERGDKLFNSFRLADDLIEEKPMMLWGVSREAQDIITGLECHCVERNAEVVHIVNPIEDMNSLHGMSGGGVFAKGQPLMYGVLWREAAAGGEFHNVRITQALETEMAAKLAELKWSPVTFINITQCKQAMIKVYEGIFHDINDSILINRKSTSFPLEARFIMPDFVSYVPGDNPIKIGDSEEVLEPIEKGRNAHLVTSIHHYGDEMQEYNEQYLRVYYEQLNSTNSREVRITAYSVLTADRKISLIVGGPGSGKSSLLKFLTLKLLSGTLTAYDGYLPVWMPFSYMARKSDCEIKEIVQEWLHDYKLWKDYGYFVEYAFEQKKILLIADGIDEWGDEPLLADRIIKKVKAETEAGNFIAIFSSREYGIVNINSPFNDSDTFTIAPLSAKQQDELVKKCVSYYNGIIQQTEHTADFLSTRLRMLQDIDRMKENPMLLTILIGQYLQGNELPHNNIAAMDCIVEQLFVKHHNVRKYEADDFSKSFDYTTNKMMLGVLSQEMFDYHQDGIIDKTQAVVLLNQYLNHQTNSHELINAQMVDDLFSHDTQQLGVLEERAGSRMAFINRQLQEFMLAKYLAIDEKRAQAFVKERAAEKGLHQVVLFLYEMMPASAFVGLYNVLKGLKTGDYRDYYLEKLKLEVLVRSVKAPEQFLLQEMEDFISRIETDSDYDVKHDLLEILLDGFYHPALKKRVEEFVAKYLPSAPVYHDIRLAALLQVPELSEDERNFVIHSLINADVNNKILASDVIKKHIANDKKLLELVNSYILPSTAPEVVAFFIRSIVVDGIDDEVERELVERVVTADEYTTFYLAEFSLFKGEAVPADEFLKIISALSYLVKDDASRVLQNYYCKDETVRAKAVSSVRSQFRERDNLDRGIAWRYLLSCWINHPDVVVVFSDELKKNHHAFNLGPGYELWEIIQRSELSQELRQVIIEWAAGRDKKDVMWGVESIIVNSIANDPRIKTKLLEALEGMTSFQHIVVSPLLKNWGQDADVIEKLQRILNEEPIQSSIWIVGYAYEIFQGDDRRIKAYLDRCINDTDGGIMKDRAVSVYITHYTEEFAEKYIPKILGGEIPMSDRILGSKWSILDAIVENYSERQDVKEYLQQNYAEDYRFAGQIIAKYHGSELASKMLKKWYHLDTRLRLMMVHKVSHLSKIDHNIEKVLWSFQQEGNSYVLCDTVICLVNHLMSAGREADVFKVADEAMNTNQITTEYVYKIRFCIYLMCHKLDEYVQLTLPSGGKEYEFAQFHIFYNDSPFIEKVLADEADYLLADDMANLKKLAGDDKRIYSYIVFFAKYAQSGSEAAEVIAKYIENNKDKVEDASLLMFIKRMGGRRQLLKELVIANIDKGNDEIAAVVEEIIVSEFKNDEEIKQLLSLDGWVLFRDSFNRVSLSCTLNTNMDKLKAIYQECKEVHYEIGNSYADINFYFSSAPVDRIVENLDYFLIRQKSLFVYKMTIMLLTKRVKRDAELADKIFGELMASDNTRMMVALYSLLISAGVKTVELRDWRNQQHECLYEYGHDVQHNRDRQMIAVMN